MNEINQINKTNQMNQINHLVRLILLVILATGFMLAKASGTIAAVDPSPDTLMQQIGRASCRERVYSSV